MFGGGFNGAGGGYGGGGGSLDYGGGCGAGGGFGGCGGGGGAISGGYGGAAALPTTNGSMQQFGGASMGYSTSISGTQSAGLAGFVGGGESGLPEQQRQSQTLTPVTLNMLQDAVKQQKSSGAQPGGMDAAYMVNGKDLGMLTLVACVESVQETQSYKNYQVNDGTARMAVQYYNDIDALVQDIRPGTYVRIFGHLRSWQGSEHISAHHVVQVENANEIPYHFIEVAHVHLSLTGKLVKAPPQAAAATAAGQTMQSNAAFGLPISSAAAPQGGGVGFGAPGGGSNGQPAPAPAQSGSLLGGPGLYSGSGGNGPHGAAPVGSTGQVGSVGVAQNPYGGAPPASAADGTFGGASGGGAGGGKMHPWSGGGLFGDQRPGAPQASRPAPGGIDLFG